LADSGGASLSVIEALLIFFGQLIPVLSFGDLKG